MRKELKGRFLLADNYLLPERSLTSKPTILHKPGAEFSQSLLLTNISEKESLEFIALLDAVIRGPKLENSLLSCVRGFFKSKYYAFEGAPNSYQLMRVCPLLRSDYSIEDFVANALNKRLAIEFIYQTTPDRKEVRVGIPYEFKSNGDVKFYTTRGYRILKLKNIVFINRESSKMSLNRDILLKLAYSNVEGHSLELAYGSIGASKYLSTVTPSEDPTARIKEILGGNSVG